MIADIGIVCFPGSNCEHDVSRALEALGASTQILWHGADSVGEVGAVVIPGGFAHGDYLRPGAIARFSPIMRAVGDFAANGGPVVGICNGFQVLTEAGLLPGALTRNVGLRFICQTVECTVESTSSTITSRAQPGTVLRLPINHYEGNYTCDPATLAEVERRGQVVLRYRENPNGAMNAIAGVANPAGNVVGLMPHPERASDPLGAGTDGIVLFEALLEAAGAWQTVSRRSAPADAAI
ncbi:MAG: phosphoribosylformylglycinamidine synthase subunit PurQ [Acidimicrobiales bacterium]